MKREHVLNGARTAAGALLLVALGACLGAPALAPVERRRGVEVALRSPAGSEVAAHYEHPVQIDPSRLLELLRETRLREAGSDAAFSPLVRADQDEVAAEAMARALAAASREQCVSVRIQWSERRLGVLHDERFSAFVAYQRDGRLVVEISHFEWLVPRDWRRERLPYPAPGREPRRPLELEAGHEALRATGPGRVEIRWRSRVSRRSLRPSPRPSLAARLAIAPGLARVRAERATPAARNRATASPTALELRSIGRPPLRKAPAHL